MSQPAVDVACLCAAWCHICGDYAPVFEQVTDELPGHGIMLHRHWIDIEDDAELVGELDVETFPTIVVADAQQVRFAGPLTPQPETLRRLLRATVTDARADTQWPAAAPAAAAFAARLRERRGSA
jgi:thioredoxin 1